MHVSTDPYQPDSGDLGQRDGPQQPESSEAAKAAEHLALWLPEDARHLDRRTLERIEPQARSAVEMAAPRTVRDVHRMLRVSFGVTNWTLDEVGFLNTETTWHPENGRAYVDDVNAHRSVDWRQEARRTFTQIGEKVIPHFWLGRTQRLSKTGPAAAYSKAVEAALGRAGFRMGEPGRPDELAVVTLGLGAGMNAPAIKAALANDVIDLGRGRVGIHVRGRHPRLVPIRADYTALALRAVEYAGNGPFITAKSRNAVYSAAERVMVHGVGHLELARARSTWLSAHLVAGTPLAVLRVIAGPLSLNTLAGLLGPAACAFSAEAAAVEGLRA